MVKLTEDSSYSLKGAFPQFLKQTDEKKITVKYILSKLREKYSFSNYTKFSFTDIGAGESAVTSPIIEFLRRNVNLEAHLIEPSSLMKILKKRCGPNVDYIWAGMEDKPLPKSDFILMAHAIQYVKDRRSFAKSLENALNSNGKILVVGTHSESDDLRLKRELKYEEKIKKKEKPRENLFEYLEKEGFKVTREYVKSKIDINNALKMNKDGEGILAFYYHKPFSEISKEEILRFKKVAEKYAPKGKLTKRLQFIWVES